MTVHTAVLHAGGFPRRGVTGFAVSARLGMGSDAAEHLSALRVQGTGVIQYTAPGVGISGNDQGGDQRRNHAQPRHTA